MQGFGEGSGWVEGGGGGGLPPYATSTPYNNGSNSLDEHIDHSFSPQMPAGHSDLSSPSGSD